MEELLPKLRTIAKTDIPNIPQGSAGENTWYRLLISTVSQNDSISCILNLGSFYSFSTPTQVALHIGVSGYGNAIANVLSSTNQKPISKIRFRKKNTTSKEEKLYIDVNRFICDIIHVSACALIGVNLVDTPYDVTNESLPEGYSEEIIEL